MKPLLSGLGALFLLTAVYAERSAERRLDSVIRQFGGSLRDQTSNGARETLHDSPEEGYLPAVSSGTNRPWPCSVSPTSSMGPSSTGTRAPTHLAPTTTMVTISQSGIIYLTL